jgi:hypothetical protein
MRGGELLEILSTYKAEMCFNELVKLPVSYVFSKLPVKLCIGFSGDLNSPNRNLAYDKYVIVKFTVTN